MAQNQMLRRTIPSSGKSLPIIGLGTSRVFDIDPKDREELNQSIKKFKDLYKDENNVPRPNHWSGWRLKHHEIEFWLDGENRIHERLKYIKENNDWKKILLSP